MRNKAFELGVHEDVKDADLQKYLDAAERRINKGTAYGKGQQLQASESVFLLDGLLKLGEANVIVGQPKVGKSSFSTGLIAALRDKRETFLGRDLMLPSTPMPVLIFGTDQSEGDWLHLLRREDIVKEDQTLDIDFFSSMETGEEYNFTKDGIRHMKEEIDKYQFPLVIIDSLSSMMEPTGIEENTSRFAQPIRSAIAKLRSTGATLVIIHHSVKRPNTWDWISECRGSSSISSVFSWGVLMRWVAQEDEGLARSDFRVGFSGKGRGSNAGGGVMGQYMDEGGWTYLDGLEAAQQVERIGQRIMELGGVRATVFDHLTVKHRMNVDVSSAELAGELNKHTSAISRELKILKAKGLVVESRRQEHVRFYELSTSAKTWWDQSALGLSEGVFPVDPVNHLLFNKKNNFNNSQDGTAEQPSHTLINIAPLTPVEVLENGEWTNSFVIRDASNLDRIVVQKAHNSTVTRGTTYQDPLRWGMEVRLCQSKPEPVPFDPSQLDLDDLPF